MKKNLIKNIAISTFALSMLFATSENTQAKSFNDVTLDDTIYYNEIEEFSKLGIINGYGNGQFGLKDNMKRSHAAKVLVESLKETEIYDTLKKNSTKEAFKDVPNDSPFYNYISIMRENGVINGYADDTFKPEENVTKAQLVKMIVEAFDIPIEKEQEQRYKDLDSNSWYYKYVNSAYNAGIITMDYTTNFNPDKNATREDLVVFTSRALKWEETKDLPLEDVIFNPIESDYKEKTTKHPNSYKMFVESFNSRSEYAQFDPNELKTPQEAVDFVLETIEWDLDSNFPVKNFIVYQDGKVSIAYDFSEEEMKRMQKEVKNKVDSILKEIIKPTYNDYDKIKAVHDYLVLNTQYDLDVYNNVARDPLSWTIYGTLIEGVAVCDGYTRAMMYMLNQLGIENYYTTGHITKSNTLHAWNIVKIDGELYHVDSTWNDPLNKPEDYIRYNYFLLNEDSIKHERTWDTSLPRATDDRFLKK